MFFLRTTSISHGVAKISTEDGTNSPSDKSDPNVPSGVKTDGGNSGGNGSRKEEKEKYGRNETEKQESRPPPSTRQFSYLICRKPKMAVVPPTTTTLMPHQPPLTCGLPSIHVTSKRQDQQKGDSHGSFAYLIKLLAAKNLIGANLNGM
ncbi:hypothetical protein L1887_17147 [Cichorium endivia]|nr:hypothetical protein L1887_17147 [Cichorium endivia]